MGGTRIGEWDRADVHVLPFLACSYGTDYLDIANIWWGSNGIESVIHNDDQDNVNCLFSGRKRMIFWHPLFLHRGISTL